jgi:hypothetical protein
MLQSIAAASVVGPLTAEAASARPRSRDGSKDEAPWALLSPLGAGSALGLGWSVADLEPIRRGAAVLVLAGPSGAEARVHLCRRDGRPQGVAWTRDLDLLLMNGGDGDDATDEALGRVLISLARRLGGAVPDGLLTHGERLATYADDHEALT